MVRLTVEETAARLKVHKVTIYKWAEAGLLQGKKVGRSWRFDELVVDNFGIPNRPKELSNVSKTVPKGRNLVLPI
jgi:excisionase family DNA binding protein